MPTPRSIADLLSKPVEFRLGDRGERPWRLLITYGVLLECESLTGLDMLGSVKNILSPTATGLRALIWALLSRDGCTWNITEVGKRLTPKIAARAREAIQKAFVISMPEPEPEPESKSTGRSKSKSATSAPHTPMSWPDTWALARIGLRLSDSEFLSITPRLLHALRKAEVHEKQWLEIQISRLTAYMINFSQVRPKEPVKEDVFMLHPFENREESVDIGDQIMQSMAGIKQRLDQVNRLHNGVSNGTPNGIPNGTPSPIPSGSLIDSHERVLI